LNQPPLPYLDSTIVERWALEPWYPAVAPEDLRKMEALQAQLKANGPLVHDLHGVSVGVGIGLHPYLAYLVVNDAYEEGDLRLIRAHVDTRDRAMVLGAGMGVIAAALSQASGAQVSCLDANPAVARHVELTASLNNVKLTFIHGAVVPGRASGSVRFALSEEFWASSLREDTYKLAGYIEAPVVDLAGLVRTSAVNTLFVDIEGAEVGLFTHETVPSGVKKLFVEVHRPALAPQQWASVLNDLYSLGFKLRDCVGLTHYWER
jgi:FkbM family methyltransferase